MCVVVVFLYEFIAKQKECMLLNYKEHNKMYTCMYTTDVYCKRVVIYIYQPIVIYCTSIHVLVVTCIHVHVHVIIHTHVHVSLKLPVYSDFCVMYYVLLLQGPDPSTHPLDFSRIYPTPPSVESTDEGVATTGLGGVAGGMPYMEEKSGALEEHLLTVSTCQCCKNF